MSLLSVLTHGSGLGSPDIVISGTDWSTSSIAMFALILFISGPILQVRPSHSRTGGMPNFARIELRYDGWTEVNLESSVGVNFASLIRFDWLRVS